MIPDHMKLFNKAGGAAFPVTVDHGKDGESVYYGMTLRDYFAAAALQALVTRPLPPSMIDTTTEDAYSYADSMLKQRQKK